MRAIWRRHLAPLAAAAAILSAAAPAVMSATPAVHAGIAMSHGCPAGTNWDSALQACV